MIFVTVGAQMPFDRLVRAVDGWAGMRKRRDVFAQVGPTSWCPANIEYAKFLDPASFKAKVEAASVIVAHAGMGSILTALEAGKPILIMPRRGDLKETRNDHQVATAKRFQGRTAVAFDEVELVGRLDELDSICAASRISSRASETLAKSLLGFVERGKLPGGDVGDFDSVIYFGADAGGGSGTGDGLRMMAELSSRVPVLYLDVNGGRRGVVAQCLRRFRSVERLGANLWAHRLRFSGNEGGQVRAAHRVKSVARRLGLRAPLIWVGGSVPVGVVDRIPHAGLVWHRTDVAGSEQMAASADVVVGSGELAFDVDGVLGELARLGIRARGIVAHGGGAKGDLLAPLSSANADLFEWTSGGKVELGSELAT